MWSGVEALTDLETPKTRLALVFPKSKLTSLMFAGLFTTLWTHDLGSLLINLKRKHRLGISWAYFHFAFSVKLRPKAQRPVCYPLFGWVKLP